MPRKQPTGNSTEPQLRNWQDCPVGFQNCYRPLTAGSAHYFLFWNTDGYYNHILTSPWPGGWRILERDKHLAVFITGLLSEGRYAHVTKSESPCLHLDLRWLGRLWISNVSICYYVICQLIPTREYIFYVDWV